MHLDTVPQACRLKFNHMLHYTHQLGLNRVKVSLSQLISMQSKISTYLNAVNLHEKC